MLQRVVTIPGYPYQMTWTMPELGSSYHTVYSFGDAYNDQWNNVVRGLSDLEWPEKYILGVAGRLSNAGRRTLTVEKLHEQFPWSPDPLKSLAILEEKEYLAIAENTDEGTFSIALLLTEQLRIALVAKMERDMQWELRLEQFGNACAYCEQKSEKTLHKDHVKPRSKHGSDDITNLVPACRSCNSSKNNRDVKEWLTKKGYVPSVFLSAFPDLGEQTVVTITEPVPHPWF